MLDRLLLWWRNTITRDDKIAGSLNALPLAQPPASGEAPPLLMDVSGCDEYRDYLACFFHCDDLTDEMRQAMRARIDAMQYQPVIAVRFSLSRLDDFVFQRALDSVCFQLYPCWELWLTDSDRATENQKKAISKVVKCDRRIKLQPDRVGGVGEGVSANLAIEGDYLYSLDSRQLPPELAFYRLALHLGKYNPNVSARIKGEMPPATYARWLNLFEEANAGKILALKLASADFPIRPLISILLPVYNTPEHWLRRSLDAVLNQCYENWELCIVDDCSTEPHVEFVLTEFCEKDERIRVVRHKSKQHISAASNSALKLASGDYVALLDHGGELSVDALLWVAAEINRQPDAMLIYSDEDEISDKGEREAPCFKPDWSPDLFLSQNFICHLAVYRTDLLRTIGGFRLGFEGSKDYDLALRFIERVQSRQIHHIPRVLYHGRSKMPCAGMRAVKEHLARMKIDADVTESDEAAGNYRVRYALPEVKPLVTLVILTRNGLTLLRQCVESIIAKTQYAPFEILIVDNGSDDPATLAYLTQLQRENMARVLRDDSSFNFSALNNRAVQEAEGDIIGLLNNDVEVITPDWLGEMVSHALRPGIGAVGARLWYPNDTLQHGGIFLAGGDVARHAHKRLARGHMGYCSRAVLIQDFSAVTAACLLLRKEIYFEVGGMDECLAVAFNDVDFCLKIQARGYRNLWTPFAELYHHESATRGHEDTPEKKARFEEEIRHMRKTWGALLDNDLAFNPNLNFYREDFSLAIPPRALN